MDEGKQRFEQETFRFPAADKQLLLETKPFWPNTDFTFFFFWVFICGGGGITGRRAVANIYIYIKKKKKKLKQGFSRAHQQLCVFLYTDDHEDFWRWDAPFSGLSFCTWAAPEL